MGAHGVAFWTILGAIFGQRSLKKCQGGPKGAQSHEKEAKFNAETEAESMLKECKMMPKWIHFSLKTNEEIDARIDAKKVMEIDEKSMRKRYRI